jgi:glycosyltransferase involved in cell wall biosynthesis
MLGVALKRRYGIRLVFDFRDFWADGGIAKGRFTSVYRYFKRREGEYIAAADQVVCLTDRAAGMLDGWYPDPRQSRAQKYQVIPCCADFALFDPARIDEATKARRRAELGIAPGETVLLYLGSLGPDYLLPQMMALFAVLRGLRPDARFLFLANNGEAEARSAAANLGIPDDAIRFHSAKRPDVPSYLAICRRQAARRLSWESSLR